MTDPLRDAVEIAARLPNEQACELVAGPIFDALSDRLIARMIQEDHPYADATARLHRGHPDDLPEATLEQLRRVSRTVRIPA